MQDWVSGRFMADWKSAALPAGMPAIGRLGSQRPCRHDAGAPVGWKPIFVGLIES